ncbi:MAG: glycosyltransferase [Tumebacillaceae bacterium]
MTLGWTPEHAPEKQNWIREAVCHAQVPLVYWATEDPLHTHTFSLPLIENMRPDYVFTVTNELVSWYQSLGIRAAHLDFAYHPSIHSPVEPVPSYRCRLAVVANAYPDLLSDTPDMFRKASLKSLIRPLVRKRIRVDFWGRDWERMEPFLKRDIPADWLHGYLPYTEANKVYSSADIVIGLQNCPDQLTQRTYEILGSGGLLLTSDTSAVRRKFQPGREVIVSSSASETVELVRYYQNNPQARLELREQAQLAIANESYVHRAQAILDELASAGVLDGQAAPANGGGELHYYHDLTKERFEIHVVEPGDTLWEISQKYDVAVAQIKQLNELVNDMIYVDQFLKIRERWAKGGT